MFLTSKKTAELDANGVAKAAQRTRAASSAAVANAATAAHGAAVTAQNAAVLAQAAAQNAVAGAANAARSAGDTAQTAASGVNKGVRQGVYTARSWVAPRLDNAADYCTDTVAPKVSSALRTTARQVRPVTAPRSKKSILTWSALGAAVLAALGAAAAMARYRYRAAIAADSETADEEVTAEPADSETATDAASPAATAKGPDSDTSVNGRVSSRGW